MSKDKDKEEAIISPEIDDLVVKVVEDEEDELLEEQLRQKGREEESTK